MQENIFGVVEPEALTIEEAAKDLGVSIATVRNWIKTGYLISSQRGKITIDSLLRLKSETIGSEKLHARANKLQKDSHDHDAVTNFLNNKLCPANFDDDIGQFYESSLSESYKNKEGIYYTPLEIIKDMLLSISNANNNESFLDPCCGAGNFLIHAIEKGIKPENIYGFDTDNNAVEITKKRIFHKFGYESQNIICGNFLDIAYNFNQHFDYIFTNPPWGKKIAKEIKERYGKLYNSGKSLDTSSLFFSACLQRLKHNGKLGFLLPDAFFNIGTFQDSRNTALQFYIERLIDYGKPFQGLMTKAQALILTKNTSSVNSNMISCEMRTQKHSRSQHSFQKNPKSIINFWLSEDEAVVIQRFFEIPHITLRGQAEWGLGIVTGNNEKFCSGQLQPGYIPVFKGSDITPEGLKPASIFIPADLNLYQQVAPKLYYEAPEKLLYKFISSKLCFYYDDNQRYILNSANMLIVKPEFPINGRILVQFFNSEVINWLFQKIFHTHKILRGDLEILPIHLGYFQSNQTFDEKTYLDFLSIEKVKNGTFRIKK